MCIYILYYNNISSPHWSFGVQFSKTNSCCISDSRPGVGSQQILAGTTDGGVKLHNVYICVHVITCIYIYIHTNTGVHNVYIYIHTAHRCLFDVCWSVSIWLLSMGYTSTWGYLRNKQLHDIGPNLQELQSYAARNLWLLSNLSNLRSRLNATDIKPDLGMVDYNYPSKFPCTLPMFYIVLHHLPICYLVYLRHFFTIHTSRCFHGPTVQPSAPETVSGRQRPCRPCSYRMDVVDLYPLPIPFFLMVKSIFQGGSIYSEYMGLKMDWILSYWIEYFWGNCTGYTGYMIAYPEKLMNIVQHCNDLTQYCSNPNLALEPLLKKKTEVQSTLW